MDNRWIMESMIADAIAEANRRIASGEYTLSKYMSDPISFGEDMFKESYTDDVKKVMRSVVENPITIAKSSTGVGKSHSAARICAWWFLTFPDSQVYVTAAPPLDNLKRILWGELLSIAGKHPELFNQFRFKTLHIARNSLSFITGVTIPTSGTSEDRVAKFSGKHSGHLLFIVDEGDAVPPEVYWGIEGCMSGGFTRLLIMFNPKAQRGPVFDMENEKRANVVQLSAFRHPNVVTGKDIIPGAVTRETVVRRIQQWTRPLLEGETKTGECFEVPEYLVGVVAKSLTGTDYPPLEGGVRVIMEPAFSYMVLGQYPAQSENQLISSEWIDAARSRWDLYVATRGEVPPDAVGPRMGLDVAEFGIDFNVVYLRYGGFVARPQRWNGVDPIVTSDRALVIYREKKVDIAMVDGSGVGSAVAPYMNRKVPGTRAMSIKAAGKPSPTIKSELGEFGSIRDQMWWACREWLRTDPSAMLPPVPMLLEELRLPTYWIDGNVIRIMDKETMRDNLKRSPNDADALILTFIPAQRAKVLRLGN